MDYRESKNTIRLLNEKDFMSSDCTTLLSTKDSIPKATKRKIQIQIKKKADQSP